MDIRVKCTLCRKHFWRSRRRVNEAKKFKWKQYCSKQCIAKSKVTRVELQCSNFECNNKFHRSPKEIRKVSQSFCSQSCAAHINNHKRIPKNKICASTMCNNTILGDKRYCSKKCISLARTTYLPQELIKKLHIISKKLGRAPAKRELGPVAYMCIRAFGSWNNAILTAGLVPHRSHSQRMYKRINTVARDGHKCDSISEAIIDNWLAKNNISHKREVPYPKTGHRADWSINGKTFIEYFGLAKDSPRYDRAIKRKRRICKKSGIKLVEIYPKDLYPRLRLDAKLGTALTN